MSRRHAFDTLALWMIGVIEGTDLVEVLAGRDVAHGVGRADKVAVGRLGQAANVLDEDIAEAPLEKLRAKRRDADFFQVGVGGGVHVVASGYWPVIPAKAGIQTG